MVADGPGGGGGACCCCVREWSGAAVVVDDFPLMKLMPLPMRSSTCFLNLMNGFLGGVGLSSDMVNRVVYSDCVSNSDHSLSVPSPNYTVVRRSLIIELPRFALILKVSTGDSIIPLSQATSRLHL